MSDEKKISQLTKLFSSIEPKKDGRVKINYLDFVVCIVFSFFTDNNQFSLSGLYREIIKKSGNRISRGSFWERLAGNPLKIIMESLVALLISNTVGQALTDYKILESLKIGGILILDSSTITLNDLAEKQFPGTKNKAGIKWHNCFDLLSGKTIWFKLSESRKHDSNFFPPLDLLKGKLIIFDLGYFEYQLMSNIQKAQAYFLCRLKTNSVVFIEKVVTGFEQSSLNKSLLSVVKSNSFKGEILEAIVKTPLKDGSFMSCRAIGFWNKSENYYHWYLTNLFVNAKLIYPLYRLRWQIELVFKACKNSLNANTITSANPNIIQTLLLGSIAAHLLTGTIYEVASNALSEEKCLAITVQRLVFVLIQLKETMINGVGA